MDVLGDSIPGEASMALCNGWYTCGFSTAWNVRAGEDAVTYARETAAHLFEIVEMDGHQTATIGGVRVSIPEESSLRITTSLK